MSARSSRTRSVRRTSSPPPRMPTTTRSCSTSSATCCSRSTSCRCCSRSAARARWRRSPTTCTRSSCAGIRTSSATWRSTARARCCATGTRSRRARRAASRGSSATCRRTSPGPLYALKTQRRAASTGFDFDHVPYEGVRGELDELEEAADREARFHEVGDVLFAAINVARKLKVDPELRTAGVSRALPGARRGGGGAGGRRRRGVGPAGSRVATRLLRPGAYRARPMSQIETVHARQILDSRGNPTVEVEVSLRSGALGRAAVPSGASTGEHEAIELRDGDKALRWQRRHQGGRERQRRDRRGDRRPRRDRPGRPRRQANRARRHPQQARLGANAILGVSLAVAQAAAAEASLPLYRYLGGDGRARAAGADDERGQRRHARGQHGRLPGVHDRAGRGGSFARALRTGVEVFHALKAVLQEKGLSTTVGDEGGFAPDLKCRRGAALIVPRRSRRPATRSATQVVFALDPAAHASSTTTANGYNALLLQERTGDTLRPPR